MNKRPVCTLIAMLSILLSVPSSWAADTTMQAPTVVEPSFELTVQIRDAGNHKVLSAFTTDAVAGQPVSDDVYRTIDYVQSTTSTVDKNQHRVGKPDIVHGTIWSGFKSSFILAPERDGKVVVDYHVTVQSVLRMTKFEYQGARVDLPTVDASNTGSSTVIEPGKPVLVALVGNKVMTLSVTKL